MIRSDHPCGSKKEAFVLRFINIIDYVFHNLMNNINNELPICSVITGDLNVRYSKWRYRIITNSAGREIDTFTSSTGYN